VKDEVIQAEKTNLREEDAKKVVVSEIEAQVVEEKATKKRVSTAATKASQAIQSILTSQAQISKFSSHSLTTIEAEDISKEATKDKDLKVILISKEGKKEVASETKEAKAIEVEVELLTSVTRQKKYQMPSLIPPCNFSRITTK
jgi:hypothetical protein